MQKGELMDDLISRQAAIDALRKMQTYKLFAGDDMILVDKAQVQTELMILPSVQPETNCSEIPNNSDTISRRAAIDEITEYGSGDTVYMSVVELKRRIEQLPSAQPEPRTAYWTKDIVGSVVCSYCGGIREDNRIGHTQWCNCCGCFMRGEEND